MIQLTPQMRVFVFTEPADFRRGIDGLVRLSRERLASEDPMGGGLFVFANRGRTALKAVVYDGQGFWLLMKRLSRGRFQYWPPAPQEGPGQHVALVARELQVLLWNGDPSSSRMSGDWKKVAAPAPENSSDREP